MALTITRTGYRPSGAARPIRGGFGHDVVMTMGEFVFGNSYASGGEALTPANVGLEDVLFMALTVEPSGTGAAVGKSVVAQYNYDTQKVMAFWSAVTTGGVAHMIEVTGNIDLSMFTVRFVAYGHKLS